MEQEQKSQELLALETLTKTAEMYLNTLDVVARPAVFQHLQKQINILSAMVTLFDSPQAETPSVADESD